MPTAAAETGITVVVCTRDRPRPLARCLAALTRLDGGPFEVVVVDNASRSPAAAQVASAVAALGPPFRLAREERPGLDRARNRGTAEAQHGLLAFTDDDTEADPGWLQALAAAFADPGVAAVAGRVLAAEVETPAQRLFEQYGGGMDKGPVRRDFHRDDLSPWELVATQEIGVGANLAVRRSALEAVGGFDPRLDVGTPARGGGDLDLFHRLLCAGFRVRYEPAAVVRHHHRREMAELRRQLRDNGCSFGVHLLRLLQEGAPPERRAALSYLLGSWAPWLIGRLAKGVLGRHPLPPGLLWQELAGALEAPRAWRAARAEGTSYALAEIELAAPLSPFRLPLGRRGAGLLLRRRGRPVGFALRELAPGTVLEPEELARLALSEATEAGALLVEEALREELGPPPPGPPLPPLTLAICTRDRPEILARCLASLEPVRQEAARNGLRLEVLVVDNAPSDGRTAECVAAFAGLPGVPRVRYVREPRPGLDFARNRALRESSGELLAFLDDDVTVDAGWLGGLTEAWGENPDAAAFTGLVLPYELESAAQILFERRGGFRRGFRKIRYGRVLPGNSNYPGGAGIFGAGADMVFRRDVLLELGGFDEALDTGPPLPGGGDLDIFYRVVRAGHPLVYEPRLLVFHQHRRDLDGLRRQYRSWGQGFLAFLVKTWEADPSQRPRLLGVARWWLKDQVKQLLRSLRGRHPLPPSMLLAELAGGLAGLAGTYPRSVRRAAAIRRQFPDSREILPGRGGGAAGEERPAPGFRPWRLLDLDLERPEGMPELRPEDGLGGWRVTVWLRDLALGHVEVAAGQLPMPASQLRGLALQAAAPAVACRLLGQPLPATARLAGEEPPADPLAALARLAAEAPLARLRQILDTGRRPLPAVSVVVCTRDRPRDLERCLESLRGSIPPPAEVLVVDNAPASPATRGVTDRFPGVRRVPEPRPGLSAARNAGLRHARGEVIAFTDDDVIVHPRWVERLAEAFASAASPAAVTGLVLPAELATEAQQRFEQSFSFSQGYRPLLFDRRFFAHTLPEGVPAWSLGAGANMAFRREVFERVGGFDERLGAGASGCSEDSELWYRLLAAGETCLYEPAAVVRHVHRRDADGLRRQMSAYMRGHVVALLVQHRRHGHRGNLKRLLVTLPRYYAKLVLLGILHGWKPRHRTLPAEMAGCLAGLWYSWRHLGAGMAGPPGRPLRQGGQHA